MHAHADSPPPSTPLVWQPLLTGSELRRLRKERLRMTRTALAMKLNVSVSTIKRWETRSRLRDDDVTKILAFVERHESERAARRALFRL